MMPQMTGLELAAREKRENLPIILLTVFCNAILEADPARTEVNAIHMKPLDFKTLHSTIQALLDSNSD